MSEITLIGNAKLREDGLQFAIRFPWPSQPKEDEVFAMADRYVSYVLGEQKK